MITGCVVERRRARRGGDRRELRRGAISGASRLAMGRPISVAQGTGKVAGARHRRGQRRGQHRSHRSAARASVDTARSRSAPLCLRRACREPCAASPARCAASLPRRRSAVPIEYLMTFDEALSDAASSDYAVIGMLAGFAVLALVLASTGLFGVVSYAVAQRTAEFGTRMALGARSTDVVRLVARESAVMLVIGLAIGLAGGIGVASTMKSVLFGLSPADPLTLGAVIGLLSLVVRSTATALPAWRASTDRSCRRAARGIVPRFHGSNVPGLSPGTLERWNPGTGVQLPVELHAELRDARSEHRRRLLERRARAPVDVDGGVRVERVEQVEEQPERAPSARSAAASRRGSRARRPCPAAACRSARPGSICAAL